MNQEQLKSIMTYDPETGLFFWLSDIKYRRPGYMEKPAGSINIYTGHRTIMYNGKRYQASHLAYLYMIGKFPEYNLTNINGVKHDVRWCNLELNYKRPLANNKNFGKNLSAFRALSMIGRAA